MAAAKGGGRVLVTGAAGLIGSAVASTLRAGREVVGLDLRPGPQVDGIADVRSPLRLEGFASVVHVAALHAPHVGVAPDEEFRAVNVESTARLLDAALAAGVGRFVLTSSTSVYGHALEPARGRAAWIDEGVEPEPRDIYDETKLEAERLVRASAIPGAILRMSRCFPEPAPEMAVHRLHRGIDRRDVARAHAMAAERAEPDCPTWIVSATPPFAREDAQALFEDTASVLRLRAPAVAAAFERKGWPLPRSLGRVYSPAKAAAELGFSTRFGALAVLGGDCDPEPAESVSAARDRD